MINFGRKHAAKLLRAPKDRVAWGCHSDRRLLVGTLSRLTFGRRQGHLFDHAGTLIGAVLARWLMVRSNKAITSSWVVRESSLSDIRRCLAG